nr:SEC-C metal-binding domain-containing protein [Pseudorhodoferax sp. Leaf274]
MTKHIQSTAELEQHLSEHIEFMKASADAFDAGSTGEAKRIAVSLRVLLHDTTSSVSLLGQLGRKSVQFVDSSTPMNPRNMLSQNVLVAMLMGPSGGSYVPFLDLSPEPPRMLPFDAWWDAVVVSDAKKNSLSRKQLILAAANQDGGAHVDPKLNAIYAALSRQNSSGWTYSEGGKLSIPKGEELAAIRQIGHEVLKTLVPGYTKEVKLPDESAMFGGAVFMEAEQAPVPAGAPLGVPVRVGRNDKCPCGSGARYKECHGKLT